jgi:hypothetical protein
VTERSTPPPVLHLPEEPAGLRRSWHATVAGGTPLADVIAGDDGIAAWLWRRWRVLAGAGIDAKTFDGIVLSYRREIWFWLEGDRTWAQCCSGLIGRVARRVPD